MKILHTQGKWEVAKHGTNPGNTSIEVQTESGLPIAILAYTGNAEANAALIASAPDLLAACQRFERALSLPESVDWNAIGLQARAAIALAQGGAK